MRDADTVVALASAGRLASPVGPWLTVDEGYPAGLVARDLRTLSQLHEVTDAVLAGPKARWVAEAVGALLGGEPVELTNPAVHLRAAISRPVPPRELRLWWTDGEELVGDGERLRARPVEVEGRSLLRYERRPG